jgi:hypothetical protein
MQRVKTLGEKRFIEIDKPIIRETLVNGEEKAILSAFVNDNGRQKELRYEVGSEWGGALNADSSDAFFVSLLYYCLFNGYDMKFESPISEQLFYQITTYFIPVLCESAAFFHPIEVVAKTQKPEKPAARGVATGLSGGVDSLYTVFTHDNHKLEDFKLTHLLFTDLPATHESCPEDTSEFIETNMRQLKPLAEEIALPLIVVRTNLDVNFGIDETVHTRHGIVRNSGLFPLKYCSLAIALSNLIGKYYFSSGVDVEHFTIHPNPYDAAYYDTFNMAVLSTPSLAFYSTGSEISRLGKTERIAEYPVARRFLSVCADNTGKNCGRCKKCVRTQMDLFAIGKLENFSEVFHVESFKKNYSWYLARTLAHMEDPFCRETVMKLHARGGQITLSAQILSVFLRLLAGIRKRILPLRSNRFVMLAYRSLRIDVLLNGRRNVEGKER